jgi:hypothetical protein
MKVSKLNEIQGVLVTAGRTDLAKVLAGPAGVPGVPDRTGPGNGQGMGMEKKFMNRKGQNKPTVVTNEDEDLEYNEHLKVMLNKMGRTFKDMKKLTPEEWEVIDNSWNTDSEAGKDGAKY